MLFYIKTIFISVVLLINHLIITITNKAFHAYVSYQYKSSNIKRYHKKYLFIIFEKSQYIPFLTNFYFQLPYHPTFLKIYFECLHIDLSIYRLPRIHIIINIYALILDAKLFSLKC